MKFALAVVGIIAFGTGAGIASAEEGGCVKYGIGGAVIGHFVGSGHALGGATVGCAIGAYKRSQARNEALKRQEANQTRQDRLR